MTEKNRFLHIAIIGAGFAGTALAAACHRAASSPLHIHLFDKTGEFAAGPAYRTPFDYHLLNVCAKDMGAFEDDPAHFVSWLQSKKPHPLLETTLDAALPLSEQFIPRCLYREYLQSLLQTIKQDNTHQLTLEPSEVIDLIPHSDHVVIVLANQKQIHVDKVILALGNQEPISFPFSVSSSNCILNPWDYTAPNHIPQDDPVLIVGTGLSMIDTVLTLHHQQHRGPIHAVSRHGLLPLPHQPHQKIDSFSADILPTTLRELMKFLRDESKELNDWRSLISAIRQHIPAWWMRATEADKKRFIRHALPYWNVHRHRVHHGISDLLQQLCDANQLNVMAGRVIKVENHQATIQLRNTHQSIKIDAKWIINCMGPALNLTSNPSPLIHSLLEKNIAHLDTLKLGLLISLQSSTRIYTLGSLRRGTLWEVSAVPEIRQQCYELSHIITGKEESHDENGVTNINPASAM